MSSVKCFFCMMCYDSVTTNRIGDFKDVKYTMPSSKKSAKQVLQHLANMIKTKLIFKTTTLLCFQCIKQLIQYDDLMVKLLRQQKQLTKQLNQTLLFTNKKVVSVTVSPSHQIKLHSPTLDRMEPAEVINSDLDVEDNNIKEEAIEIDEMVIEKLTDNLAPDRLVDLNDLEIQADNEWLSNDESDDDDYYYDDDDDDDNEKLGSAKINGSTEKIAIEERLRRAVRGKRQECADCGAKYNTKKLLQEHFNTAHNRNVFKCEICKVTRKDRENLELHMNIHRGKSELECCYCDKTFTRSVNTIRHMRKHWNRQEFQCEKCGVLFSQDCLLYNHRLVHQAEENPLICELCCQMFKSRKTYKHHLTTHRKDRKRHGCPRCPKSFTERYSLKVHMQVHGETLPYLKSNNLIQRKLETKDALRQTSNAKAECLLNAKRETEDYVCTICERNFARRRQLDDHLEVDHDVIIS